VIRREATQAKRLPGEILDGDRIEIFKRRLGSLSLCSLANDPEKPGKQIRVEVKRRRPPDEPCGNLMLSDQVTQARMQDPPAGGGGPAAP
jgi:hypothetical protein